MILNDNKDLTDKQKIFIAEYCNNGFNGTQAAIKAGYSENSAQEIASENLSKPIIKNCIKAYLDEILSQYKDTLEYEIIQHYKTRAFYDISEILTPEGAFVVKDLKDLGENRKVIDAIETTINASNRKNTKIKLANREESLKQLALYMNIIKSNETNFKADLTGLDTIIRALFPNRDIS
jgi:phage terminase small subunit